MEKLKSDILETDKLDHHPKLLHTKSYAMDSDTLDTNSLDTDT